jgi:hypothetical protein
MTVVRLVIKKRGENPSGKDKTIFEIFDVEDFTGDGRLCNALSYKPLVIFLEYTFTRDAEIIAQSIKSALGSYCLPTTVKDGHGVVVNLGNLVAVETYHRNTSLGIKVNRSVSRLPVNVGLDCVAHLLLDLAHGK